MSCRPEVIQLLRLVSITMLPISGLFLSCCGVEDRTDLDVTAPTTTLRMGETVQLAVARRLPDGSTLELTSPGSGSIYFTTSESMLIPEPDGRVTCIGTDGRDQESAVIGVSNGDHHGHIRFKLLPSGPGPALEVISDRTVLREGEKAQLHVFTSLPNGRREESTATSTGTRYLTFAGNAVPDTSVLTIDGTGLASTTDSIGSFTHRTVIVFVRNESAVGWIVMTVVRDPR